MRTREKKIYFKGADSTDTISRAFNFLILGRRIKINIGNMEIR